MTKTQDELVEEAKQKVLILERLAYINGFLAGLEKYAYWKDGVQYVGTTGKTLKQAKLDFFEEFDAKDGQPQAHFTGA